MKTIAVVLTALVLLVGCGKSNPVATTPAPPPEATNLALQWDGIGSKSEGGLNYSVAYVTLLFTSNRDKACTISEIKHTTSWGSYNYVVAPRYPLYNNNKFSFNSVVGPQTLHGTVTVFVTATWEGWSGVKRADFSW